MKTVSPDLQNKDGVARFTHSYEEILLLTTFGANLYLDCENFADSDPVIIPYKALNIRFMPLYGTITESLSAKFSQARYSM